MKLKLVSATLVKDLFKAAGGLVDEPMITVKDDILDIISMDPSNVAMVSVQLLSSAAVEWETTPDKDGEPEQLSFKLAEVNKILKRAGKDDMLVLETTEDSKLQIGIGNGRKFQVSLLATEEMTKQNVPELAHKATITLPTKRLMAAVGDCGLVADNMGFIVDKDKLVLDAEGDLSKAVITLAGEDIKVDGEFTAEKTSYKSKFATDFLNKMIHTGLSESVTVHISDEYPIQIKYRKQNEFNVMFLCAPRVENT